MPDYSAIPSAAREAIRRAVALGLTQTQVQLGHRQAQVAYHDCLFDDDDPDTGTPGTEGWALSISATSPEDALALLMRLCAAGPLVAAAHHTDPALAADLARALRSAVSELSALAHRLEAEVTADADPLRARRTRAHHGLVLAEETAMREFLCNLSTAIRETAA